MKQVQRVPRLRILLLALPSPARDPPIVLKSSSMAARRFGSGAAIKNPNVPRVSVSLFGEAALSQPISQSIPTRGSYTRYVYHVHIYVLGDRIEEVICVGGNRKEVCILGDRGEMKMKIEECVISFSRMG